MTSPLWGGGLLSASDGINLISVGTASRGEVPIDTGTRPLDLTDDFETFGEIELLDGTSLSTSNNGGSRIVIRGGQLLVDRSLMTSINAGNIDSLQAGIDIAVTGSLRLTNGSVVVSAARRAGSGGSISVTAHDIFIEHGSSIATFGLGTGSAGDVRVHADASVTVQASEGNELSTGIFSYAGFDSEAGVIEVRADRFVMNGGVIGTSPNVEPSQRPRSGNVEIVVGHLMLTDGARIDSSTESNFAGGTITVQADTASLTGESVITAGTTGAGDAGDIHIDVDRLTLQDGSEITSDSQGEGDAGLIQITADEMRMSDSLVTTSAQQANGGNIVIESGRLHLQNSFITATVNEQQGEGGNIDINADLMVLEDSEITSESRGTGDAGMIEITANEIRLLNSTVTTNAQQANGGNIVIKSSLLRLHHSAITATVNEQQGAGGNIDINSELVVLENSEIIARASEGRGGNIDIVAKALLADADTVIDASSDKGINGTVNIDSIIDLNENVNPLPRRFAEPNLLLKEPCAEHLRGGQVSSFVLSGRAGIPAEPSSGLPSLMVDIPESASEEKEADSAAHLPPSQAKAGAPQAWRQASLAYDCQHTAGSVQ